MTVEEQRQLENGGRAALAMMRLLDPDLDDRTIDFHIARSRSGGGYVYPYICRNGELIAIPATLS